MRANANPPRAFAVAAASLVAALAIAACGSDSDSDASGDSGSGGDSALVKQADERVAQARQPIEEFSGPSEPAGAPPAGKSVAMVNVIPGPFPNHLEEGVEEAATAVGWDVRGFSADGTPQGFQTTLSAALATNPDAIVLLAMPAALVQQQPGAPVFIAWSWILQILLAKVSDKDPPKTVKS